MADVLKTPFGVKAKLSLMMLLQFLIWGAWFELGFGYIPSQFATPWHQQLIFGAFNFGALVALFFSTQLADRKFAAERFLAFSHLISGLALLGLFYFKADVFGGDKTMYFWAFFGCMLVHSLFYVPTVSITNSIAFAHLKNPTNEFGPVRVWGTIGWIVASWPFVFILVDWAGVDVKVAAKQAAGETVGMIDKLGMALGTSKSGADFTQACSYIFLVAAIASFALAAVSLFLPHTPPKKGVQTESLAWVAAIKLLKNPIILVLFVVTFIDAAVHQSFFFWTGSFLEQKVGIPGNWIGPVMKIGQIAEILTMLVLGYVLKTFGWRTTMIVGVLGHAARFAVFMYYPAKEAAILINVVHGICYAFFFATLYIFVDEYFPKDVRSSAQGLFNMLILGVGPFVANMVCVELRGIYSDANPIDPEKPILNNYNGVMQYSLYAAIAGAVILALFFHPKKKNGDQGAV